MDRDDVIRMASSIGFELEVNLPALERFANLVWNHALESAAKECDEIGFVDDFRGLVLASRTIRAMKVGAGRTAPEGHNAKAVGPGAASSRTVPTSDGLCVAVDTEKET